MPYSGLELCRSGVLRAVLGRATSPFPVPFVTAIGADQTHGLRLAIFRKQGLGSWLHGDR
jgi:hypothetical protein